MDGWMSGGQSRVMPITGEPEQDSCFGHSLRAIRFLHINLMNWQNVWPDTDRLQLFDDGRVRVGWGLIVIAIIIVIKSCTSVRLLLLLLVDEWWIITAENQHFSSVGFIVIVMGGRCSLCDKVSDRNVGMMMVEYWVESSMGYWECNQQKIKRIE